ncbi:MAG: aminotransferase class I/II-fold pyridoxal phosphate-dependent enzyme [Alphaproteobacteria bacterium]|nr:aminotransferase class I/II-fold pyridoxal phosphate-dependent enzyme [Alphaproteobacteria bacterium]
MIPLTQPDLSGNESRYLQECIASTYVSSVGPFVSRFERLVAEATGSAGAVATSSGTTALHAALLAAGVGAGDLVVLPTFTFIASANAIAHCGAGPWLLDVDPSTWALDTRLLRRSLERDTRRDGARLLHTPSGRRIAAVMPVYTLGAASGIDRVVAAARDFGLPVVADAAAALGATSGGQAIGEFGADFSVISFNGNKTVTSGGGGAVVGNDLDALKALRHLTSTARLGDDYTHDRIGYNYRMTNLQAAVGCAQMERWRELVGAKRRIRARYAAGLRGLNGVGMFPTEDGSACWLSGITLGPSASPLDQVRAKLRDAGIEARPFWRPMHLQAPYREAPVSAMPVADAIWPTVLTLPCSTGLSEADQDRVIDTIRGAAA